MPGAHEHEKPRATRADDLAVDPDGCPRDPLDDGAHPAILYARRMGVVELRDREVIAEFCRRRPAVHAYALGDLDDFFWPHTRWLGWERGGHLEQLVLLYDEPETPVLLALAEPPAAGMADLLAAVADELPSDVYAHITGELVGALPRFAPTSPPAEHRKLGLVDPSRLDGHPDRALPLGPDDLDEVLAFYARAYPGTWFEPRMLETRRYVGIRDSAVSRALPASTSGRRSGASRPSATSRPCRRPGAAALRPPRARTSAASSSTTGSTRSRSTSGRTTQRRSRRTRGSASRTPPTTSRFR